MALELAPLFGASAGLSPKPSPKLPDDPARPMQPGDTGYTNSGKPFKFVSMDQMIANIASRTVPAS